MKIITYKGGGVFNANCYIVISESGNAAIIALKPDAKASGFCCPGY